ncbi:hypothetical protein [Enhygromyxa salina]|uniref:hypothetical protein n=1 Tax=Enhygromyxa salina TaxID=215803 RepID=UPI0011B1FE75|nr:hypothetical protein [Enhygromyxa salina]
MRFTALLLTAAVVGACSPAGNEDESDSSTFECAEESLFVRFDSEAVAYAELHDAIAELPGTRVHAAVWLDEDTPTQITTTINFVGESYELTVIDQELACSMVVSVPVHVTVATNDGYLLVDEQAVWGQSGLTQPFDVAADIELGAKLSTVPDASGWLTFDVAQLWPDVAQPDDDAELAMEVAQRVGELRGILYYSRREIVDGTTVLYYQTPLLEWGPK